MLSSLACTDWLPVIMVQELVFIGADMDEAAINKQLDTALLTPEEMAKYLDHHKDQVGLS